MPRLNEELEDDLLNDFTQDDSSDEQDALRNEEDDDLSDDLPDDLSETEDHSADGDLSEDDDDDNERPQPRRQQRERTDPRRQQQPRPKRIDPFNPDVRLEEDAGKNLLGPDGSIIARAGRERKNFEAWRNAAQKDRREGIKLATRLSDLAQQSKQLYDRYKLLENQKTMFDQAGLAFEDQKLMLDVAVAYKKNPIDGIKLMLTKAHMAGVDITALGAGGGLDPSVIVNELKQHIDQRFAPIDAATTESEDRKKIESEARTFFVDNPEALEFAAQMGNDEFAAVMKDMREKFPNETLSSLWSKLHYALLKRGYTGGNTGEEHEPEERGNNRPRRRVTTPVMPKGRNHRRANQRQFDGSESIEAIGASVLADLERLNSSS